LCDVQEALEVGRHQRLEVVGRVFGERLGEEDAGIVDQDVDRPEARQGRLDDIRGRCRFADVTVHQRHVIGGRDLVGSGHFAGIGNHIETTFEKRFHNSCADPLRRSGHDRCLAWAGHG
jgi:hypothetical protein